MTSEELKAKTAEILNALGEVKAELNSLDIHLHQVDRDTKLAQLAKLLSGANHWGAWASVVGMPHLAVLIDAVAAESRSSMQRLLSDGEAPR